MLAGLICVVGSLCWCLSWLGRGRIYRPCDLCPELVWSRARKRSKALALQAETHLIKTIMSLYMCPVVGRLLANQMPQILLRIKQSGWASLMRWRRVRGLWCITLDLSLRAVHLNKSSGDGRPNHLAGCDGDAERLAESRDQGGKSQGPAGLIWVQRVPGRRHTCKNIDGISD